MKIKFCILFAIALAGFMLPAAQLPAEVKVSPNGTLLFEGGKLQIVFYDRRWRGMSNADFKDIRNNINREGGTLTAKFNKNEVSGKFKRGDSDRIANMYLDLLNQAQKAQ